MRQSTTSTPSAPSRLIALAVLILALWPAWSASAAEPLVLELDGGWEATIYDGDYILDNFGFHRDGKLYLNIPGYPLTELVLPPLNPDPKDHPYHPHKVDHVVDALEAITLARPVERVEIFVLPLPRTNLLGSSAVEGRIFLSPGSGSIPAEVTHMVTTHEMGHVFHYEHLGDDDSAAWSEYRTIRDIEDTLVFTSAGVHRNRPHEIFAEDFRFLYGGALANYSGNIENSALPLPTYVEGLAAFIQRVAYAFSKEVATGDLTAANYPNPFNPETRITVTAAAASLGQPLSVRVFDARGRLVRTLHTGTLDAVEMNFRWDGRDASGGALPSGVYFSHVRLGPQSHSHKMIFIG